MRIVQVANFVHPTSGGVRIAIDELGARYADAGHDVMWIRPGASHHMAPDDRGRVLVELPGAPLPSSNGYRLFLRRAPVAALVASFRPDVVEVHDTATLTWVGSYAKDLGAISVMFAHERLGLVLGDHLGSASAMRRAASWHHRRSVEGFDLVVAPSRYAALEFAGLAPVHVVPLGVDLDVFHPDRRHDIRRPPRPRRVLLVSRLTREKRPVLAAQAVNELRWRGVDVELLVAGDGPLHTAVLGTGAGSGVRMLGHVADRLHLASVLADADVVICPGPRGDVRPGSPRGARRRDPGRVRRRRVPSPSCWSRRQVWRAVVPSIRWRTVWQR